MDAQPYSAPNFEFAAVIEASLAALARNVAIAKNIPVGDSGCGYIVKLVLDLQRACGCTLIDKGDLRATSSAVTAIIGILDEMAARNLCPVGSEPKPVQSGKATREVQS